MIPVTWSVGLAFREGWRVTGPLRMNKSSPGKETRWESLPNTGSWRHVFILTPSTL